MRVIQLVSDALFSKGRGELISKLPVLQHGDVLKVDIGVHVKGRILDSAFTLNFEPTYDKLLEAVKAATDTGIRVRPRSNYSHIRRSLLTFILYRNLELTFVLGKWGRPSRKPWSLMRLKSMEKCILVCAPMYISSIADSVPFSEIY